VLEVTERVVAEAVEPLGLNLTTLAGGTNLATNQLFPNPGFEPIVLREIQRVTSAGPGWFEFDNMTWYELRGPGFGNGAAVRLFRLVDDAGKPLPYSPQGRLDVSRASQVVDLGQAKVRRPDRELPLGGWVATRYGSTGSGGGEVRYTCRFTDPIYVAGEGETGWYVVKAVDASGNESAPSSEVSATPSPNAAAGVRLVGNGGRLQDARAGAGYWTSLSASGGTPPYRFAVVEGSLPAGIVLDSASGSLSGTAAVTPPDTALTMEVRDGQGTTDRRVFHLNAPADRRDEADKTPPEPPANLKAVASRGAVTLTWDPSPSPDVTHYRVLRSDVPRARQQERVYLDPELPLLPGDYAFICLETREMLPRTSHFRVRTPRSGTARSHGFGGRDEWTYALVPHPGPLPEGLSDHGQTCLEITANSTAQVGGNPAVFFPWQGYTGEDKWYSQLHPGSGYRVQVWLRQDGRLGDSGQVRFVLNGCYADLNAKTPWAVTDQWQPFTYEFTAPPYPTTGSHSGPGLAFTGPGRLYVDNFVVYRADADHPALNVPIKATFDEILASMPAEGRKGCLRFYGLGFCDATMAAYTDLFAGSTYTADWYTAVSCATPATLPVQMEYARRTGSSPETRVVPMITLPPDFFPEEWQGLVEYLGVPYDPAAGDTPQTKPWAYKRFRQRGGVGTPWTDGFREIVIEIGNETWHNKALPMWDGFGWTGAVMQGGKEYGLFAKLIIDQSVKTMPAWRQYDLGRRIRWSLGANYSTDLQWGYGELAVAQGADVAYLGHANYVGPKWETGDKAQTEFGDDGVQKTLLGFLMDETARKTVDSAAASRDTLRAQGKAHYELIAYEGGPSGYDHRNLTNLTPELYGKSEAMAVAALDAWLHSSLMGYRHQCYLGYASGYGWSSHTMPEAGGFRAHAGWLALKLRNRFAEGDRMVETKVIATPTLTLQGKDWPLVGAYALTDGAGTWSVFVLSRKLDGRHSGADLGDGCTPVTLRLPFARAAKIALHALAKRDGSPANPRDNNLAEEKVRIASKEIPASALKGSFSIDATTGGLPGGLPPGGIFLYVFEGCGNAP